MDKTKELQNKVTLLETRLKRLEDAINLEDNFTSRQVFKREVQFMAKVYDKTGALVTEINA